MELIKGGIVSFFRIMKNGCINKSVRIHIVLLVVFFSLVACDLLSKKPEKISFLEDSFSVMKPGSWSLRSDLNEVADLQMGNPLKEAYVIIISENKMDFDNLSLEEHSEITRSSLREGLKNFRESEPEYLDNGEYATLRYRLAGNINGVNIVYWHVTIETPAYFHQMLLWSLKSKFSKNEADFNAVIQSFEVINE